MATDPLPADAPAATPARIALRPREAAAALGISPRKLWEITADRNSGIPHCRFGKTLIYPTDALRRWLELKAGCGDD